MTTSGRRQRRWSAAWAIVYLAILILRAWGAHRFLHFEEVQMVGASRTLDWRAVWDDHAYGFFVQWAIVEISTWPPLAVTPMVIVGLTVLVWWWAAVWIRQTLLRSGVASSTAVVGPLALCLVPLPEIGYLGLASSAGWPLAAAGIVVAAVGVGAPTRGKWVEICALGLVAASHPTGLIVVLIAGGRAALEASGRLQHLARAAAAGLGVGVSAFVAAVQDPPSSYLGAWAPRDDSERDVLRRLAEGGALEDRLVGRLDVGRLLSDLPGSVRFVATQFLPEPWSSRSILETSATAKVLQIALPVALLACVAVMGWRRGRSRLRPALVVSARLGVAAGVAVLVQHVLTGQLNARQYLFLPMVLGWCAVLVLGTEAISRRAWRIAAVVTPLVAWFALAAVQHVRDPFQGNPRQGGTGRYAEEDLWRPALARARAECQTRTMDDVVVVSQLDPRDPGILRLIETSGLGFAWFDHALVVRCAVIGR